MSRQRRGWFELEIDTVEACPGVTWAYDATYTFHPVGKYESRGRYRRPRDSSKCSNKNRFQNWLSISALPVIILAILFLADHTIFSVIPFSLTSPDILF